MIATTVRHVESADGTSLAVHETGDVDLPTIVAVHGYPDDHTVWDAMTPLLAQRFRVAAYDVRGTGDSSAPAGRAGYLMDRLVEDFAAVIDAVSPDRPVHVLAHDWGSIQCWAAVTDARLVGRVASYTSISGPSLDYSAAWMRDVRAHPRASLSQFGHSYYILLFQLPRLPELAARRGLIDRGARSAGSRTSRSEADTVNGIELYRANMLRRFARPNPVSTDVAVQVLAPKADPFVSARLQHEAPEPYVANLTTHVVDGGHWVVAERPNLVARYVFDFVDSLDA